MACAAEIFRFLRDMALESTASQSPSLLLGSSFVGSKTLRQREKNFYGAPPITSRGKGSAGMHNLIHPGAILCMIDLLPSVGVPEEIRRVQTSAERPGDEPLNPENLPVSNDYVESISTGCEYGKVSPEGNITTQSASNGDGKTISTHHTHIASTTLTHNPATHTESSYLSVSPVAHPDDSSSESDNFYDAGSELDKEDDAEVSKGSCIEGAGERPLEGVVTADEGMAGVEQDLGEDMDEELAWKVSSALLWCLYHCHGYQLQT